MLRKIILFSTSSLGRRFLLSLILTIVFPLLILLLLFQKNVSKKNFAQDCEINLEVLKQTRESLESFANDIEFVSKNILGDQQVQEYLKIYSVDAKQEMALSKIKVSYTIQPIMQHRPIISAISIFDEERIYCQFGTLVNAENTENIETVKALKGKGIWVAAYQYTYPMLEKYADQYIVSFMRAINDLYSMNQLAIERISIDEDDICDLYNGLNMEGSTSFIMNNDGAIISSTDKSMLGTVVEQSDYVRDGKTEGWFRNGDKIYFYFQLSHPDWIVVQLKPLSYFTSGYNNISGVFYLCLLLTGVFALLFYRIQERTIIRPVKAIAVQTERFGNGADEIEMCVSGNDEIAVLNRAFVDMSVSIRELIEREYKSKLSQKEIELAYMQSQINPHFLSNTLETIRWMAILEQQSEIAEQIEALSSLFRHMLNDGKATTTIRAELAHIDNYMKLMGTRFGKTVRYEKQISEEILDCEVLNLILQPLVENAITHGIGKKRGGGVVRVVISNSDEKIYYQVTDDGVGTDEQEIQNRLNNKTVDEKAFALRNINQRIRYRYGEEFGLIFRSIEGEGTTVTVVMPLQKEGKTVGINRKECREDEND